MERLFNLLDEPWILVRSPDCTVKEVSLTDALLHAHEYEALAGELPTQDVAVLRLLLAVLYTVFSRVDANGKAEELLYEEDALNRWETLWNGKQFPTQPILDYLSQWKDRFWLFDEEYPFWQTPAAKEGTAYGAAKLNGVMSESSNKLRLFPVRSAESKNTLSFAEAARWLLYVNGFDDTSAKPKAKGLPSPGAGWLGKLGLIYAVGNNLFETLLLNLVFLKDGQTLWSMEPDGEKDCPAWERTVPHAKERTEITMPDNYAELLTLQSRRLLLQRDGKLVVGYQLLGGDFFPKENAIAEQMTVWRNRSDPKKGLVFWNPRRHDATRQIWRDFSEIAVLDENSRTPGIVAWIARLRYESLLSGSTLVKLQIVAVQYGDKDFFVTDAFSDTLSFHVDLLTEAGYIWRQQIDAEIHDCDTAAFWTGVLAENLSLAAGGEGDSQKEQAKAQFYARLDAPFRQWLQKLNPKQSQDEIKSLRLLWRNQARNLALQLGQELVDAAGEAAFVGRMVGPEDQQRHYSAPEAYQFFKYRINKLYPQEAKK